MANAWYWRIVIWRHLITPLVTLLITGCSRPDGDIRAWRPGDHDQEAVPALPGPSVNALSPQEAVAEKKPVDAVATWSSLCSGCHGRIGDGNGPMGPAMGARNLADPRWQATITDDQIATSILRGKGRMPAFSLPSETIKGLVRLIRGRQLSDKDSGS
jgi:mono/diheme cytochrome c family protein